VSPDDLPDLLTARELDHLVQTDPTAALRAAHRWLSGARTDDHALQAAATNALARSLFELGDVERAAAAARSAVAAADRAGDPMLSFSVVMSASAIFAEAGKIEEALHDLEVIAPGGTASERGRLLVQRAYVLHHAGRLGEALALLDRAEPEFTVAGDELGWLRLLVNRGLIRLQQGNLDLSESDLVEADRVAFELGQDAMRAGIASNLGVVYGRCRRIRDALEKFELALELHEAAGRPGRMVAVTELDRAETLMHAGLVFDAIAAAEAAIVHVEPSGNLVMLGDSHLLLARCQMAAGRFRQARHAAASAVVLFDRTRRPETAALGRSVATAAGLSEAVDSGHPAFGESALLVAELERNGWTQAADDLRIARLRCAVRIGALESTAAEVEYLRLGSFSDHRHRALAGWFAEAIARAVGGDLSSALDACRSGLDRLDDIVDESPSLEERSAAMRLGHDLSQLAIDFAIGLGEADTVLAAAEGTRARALHDELAERNRHRPLTIEGADQLRRELGARLGGSSLVEWVISREQVWAVVFSEGHSRLVHLGPLRPILHARDRVMMWLDRAAEQPDASSAAAMRAARLLDELLLAPLALRQGAGAVLVPVGDLHGIPWSGMPSLAGCETAMSPNAQLWLEADRRAAAAMRTIGLIEGPNIATADVERAAVESVYRRVTVAGGVGAAASTVRSMFAGLDLVHVAAHGTFRSDHPLLSTLDLADGKATLYDSVPARLRSRLVVLSSCEGGAHGAADGSEVLGLAAVMLARGAAAVLAPLTVVRELECADFVSDVHRELASGDAFGRAVATVRRRWLDDDDLSRWAVASSFTCFGSTRVAVAR
jgi:tetratricopeptide (TPR) repeat protein